MDFDNKDDEVIATQGPMEATRAAFLQMIVENGVGTVVMLTNLEEKEKGEYLIITSLLAFFM